MSADLRVSGEQLLVGFTHALRAAGVKVTHDRTSAYLEAASRLGAGARDDVRRAGRATLCSGPDDLARHDLVFDAWYTAHPETPRGPRREQPARPVRAPLPLDEQSAPREDLLDDDTETLRAAASDVEVLAHRDVASLSSAEKALLDAMIRALHPRLPQRRATRRQAWRRGEVDVHRTLRTTLRRMGEPGRVEHRRRQQRPRRVVLLVDVSGSMRPYADALLRLAHALAQVPAPAGSVETFTLGTRLTRVTESLRTADPERALVRAGQQVPDWSGGTRLGETLGAFLDRWGARGMARGAVVVVFSDGWERGDAAELGRQMQRLRRLARRVVWVNPHRGKSGYEPVQLGIAAALPHCDDFVAGHSLRTFEELLEVVARA